MNTDNHNPHYDRIEGAENNNFNPSNHDFAWVRARKQAVLGFLVFFTVLAVIQAAINVIQPEPALWPALFALVMVVATVMFWRRFLP
ncbi:hypothetical membrane protein [Corynebacterium kutscheri]|uniref:Uncharacterized protein n=1 Tax=Corynebacterium kutscheri TaxID=35755 RepID=A0A0F6TCZ3_9CORY|nr:hypothetical protein [Corynebacterium kutscheri]AKE40689.1 hypothetical protein UL82_02320 [Corynebacterium kutscheri]VEH11086.1 hypothetical membrane protein [Corynebacterium kutscheri]VEH80436.1 hypothetical membrane protein [Corynebacterium kutscheri]